MLRGLRNVKSNGSFARTLGREFVFVLSPSALAVTIALILFAEFIAESFDVDPKLVRDHFTRPCVVIFGVMSLPRIGSPVGQCFNDPKFLRDKSPILVEALKFTDEIGKNISVMIDKPIELVAMRRRMDAGGAAVLDPIDKLLERHFVSELPHFFALIKRNDSVPGVANEPELKVGLELLTSGAASVLLWQCEIKNFQRPGSFARPHASNNSPCDF